jgi:hypothetical protein
MDATRSYYFVVWFSTKYLHVVLQILLHCVPLWYLTCTYLHWYVVFVLYSCIYVVSYAHVALLCFVILFVYSCYCGWFCCCCCCCCYPRAFLVGHVAPMNVCRKLACSGCWTFYYMICVTVGIWLYSHLHVIVDCLHLHIDLYVFYFWGQMCQSISKPKPRYLSQFWM